jgi:hypothetical protein
MREIHHSQALRLLRLQPQQALLPHQAAQTLRKHGWPRDAG